MQSDGVRDGCLPLPPMLCNMVADQSEADDVMACGMYGDVPLLNSCESSPSRGGIVPRTFFSAKCDRISVIYITS